MFRCRYGKRCIEKGKFLFVEVKKAHIFRAINKTGREGIVKSFGLQMSCREAEEYGWHWKSSTLWQTFDFFGTFAIRLMRKNETQKVQKLILVVFAVFFDANRPYRQGKPVEDC